MPVLSISPLRPLLLLVGLLAVACQSPDSTTGASSTAAANASAGKDFVVHEVDGRLWVFRTGSKELAEYEQHGEPAKAVTLPGAGPNGMTIRGPDRATIAAWLATNPTWTPKPKLQKEGFDVFEVDGRLWVFRTGSKELAEYQQHGEPAKSVTVIGKGPGGMTIKGPDRETIEAYLAQ